MKTTRNNPNPHPGANLLRTLRVLGLLATVGLLIGLFAVGCGSGSKGNSGTSTQSRMNLTFTWPDISDTATESRRIPRRARSLRLQVKQDGAVIRDVIRNRPASQAATEETITLDNLPFVSGLQIDAFAHDGADGSGTVLAVASKPLVQSGSAFAELRMTLGSVVDNLEVSSPGIDLTTNSLAIRVGDTRLVTVTPKQGSQIVLIDPQEIDVTGAGADFDVQKSPNSLTLTVIGKKRNGTAGTVTVKHDRSGTGTQFATGATFTVLVKTRVTLENVDFFNITDQESRVNGYPDGLVKFTVHTDSGFDTPKVRFSVKQGNGVIPDNGTPQLLRVIGDQFEPVTTDGSAVTEVSNGAVIAYRVPNLGNTVVTRTITATETKTPPETLDRHEPGFFTLNIDIQKPVNKTPQFVQLNSQPLLTKFKQGEKVPFIIKQAGADVNIVLQKKEGNNWSNPITNVGNTSIPIGPVASPTSIQENELRIPLGSEDDETYRLFDTVTSASREFTVPGYKPEDLSPGGLAGRKTIVAIPSGELKILSKALADYSVEQFAFEGASVGTLERDPTDTADLDKSLRRVLNLPGKLQPGDPTSIKLRYQIRGKAQYSTTFTFLFPTKDTPYTIPHGSVGGTIR